MKVFERLRQYAYLLRLHKPIGIYLLLWPTLWALWLASEGRPSLKLILIFVTGTIIMRSAGCIINDYADRHFDGRVARTRERPLATGKVSVKEAGVLFVILLLLAFVLVLQLNPLTIGFAFFAVAITLIYPFLKRFTQLPQLGLGIAYAWGVPMAFIAQTGELSREAWALFFLVGLWTLMYDTLYAMTDRDDDLKIGIKSTAILFSSADRLILALLQVILVVGFAALGVSFDLGFPYYASVALAALLFLYQQSLIAKRQPANCFKAFLNNNWVGAILFLGIVLSFS